jgi:PAS domain S-box-containing protein
VGRAQSAGQRHKGFRNLILRRITEDGSAYYAIISGSPIFDASGHFKGYRGVGADITERLQAEERFRATFDQAAVGIAHISFDHRHLLVNKRYCEMLGYTREEILALNADAVFVADGPGDMSEARAQLLAGDIDHYSGERQYIRKNRAIFWVNRTISLARDASGKALYSIRVIEDISERKAVEMAHRRSEAEFAALFDQAAVGMAQTDMEGVFLRVNAKLAGMLGHGSDELLGRPFRDITHPDDLTRNLDLLSKLATGEIGEYTYEKRYLRKDGTPVWVSVTMSRARVSAIESPFAVAVVEDISERKRAEERLTYLAQYDSLTGLPNRNLVRDRLSLAIAPGQAQLASARGAVRRSGRFQRHQRFTRPRQAVGGRYPRCVGRRGNLLVRPAPDKEQRSRRAVVTSSMSLRLPGTLIAMRRIYSPFGFGVALLLALLPARGATAPAADDISVDVHKNGPEVVVRVDCPVRAPRAVVWEVLTDYDHMASFVTNLAVSELRARNGDTLQVFQRGAAARGPFSFSFENLREIRLVPQEEIRSRLISGTLKASEFTTRILDGANELHIINSGHFIPDVWVPPVIGPAVIEAETRKQFEEIRTEIRRRFAKLGTQ